VNSAAEHAHVEVAMRCLDKSPGTALKCLWGLWEDGADCAANEEIKEECLDEEYKVKIHIPPYSGRIFSLSHVEPTPEGAAAIAS